MARTVSYTNAQARLPADTYPLAIIVEEGLELDDVWVPDDAHDLQFTVLRQISKCEITPVRSHAQTDLEALVLEHALDGGVLSTRRQLGLENDAEGAVAHNLALRVCQVLVLARLAILHLFADNFCAAVSIACDMVRGHDLPPILRDEKADGRFWLIVWCYATRGGSAKRCADCSRGCGEL